MTRRLVVAAAGLALLQLAALVVYREVSARRAERPFLLQPLDDPAPVLSLEGPDGSRAAIPDRRGSAVLLHFWATWCPPCREELPALLAAAPDLRRAGIRVVAVSVDDPWEAIARHLGGAVPDGIWRVDAATARAAGVTSLPDSYLLGPDGRRLARMEGARAWAGAAPLRALGDRLARAGAGPARTTGAVREGASP